MNDFKNKLDLKKKTDGTLFLDMELVKLNESTSQQEYLLNKHEKNQIKSKNSLVKLLKSNLIIISIISSIIIGFSIGICLKYTDSSNVSPWFILPGKLFLRALRLFILPVIFFGVLNATSSINTSSNAKLSSICLLFVLTTHIIACSIGIGGSFLFKIINKKFENVVTNKQRDIKTQKNFYDIFVDILNNLIPKNIVKATMYQEFTQYDVIGNSTDNSTVLRTRKTVDVPDTNVLGVLTFAILIGMATGSIGKKGDAFRSLVQSINHIVMTCLRWIIMFGPLGFASLIIDAILSMNDLEKNLKELGIFILIVTSCCIFYGVVVLSVACFLFARKNPFKYYFNFFDPILLAFASTSSGVCIHRSIETCEDKLKLNPIICRFSLPFYTALQADGSAMFITMSTIFLAYFNNYTLSFSDYVIILVMSSILCLSLPCVPSSSLITILVVLASINLNVNIAPLYACEWILDRVRTAVNVYSHCVCTVMTDSVFKNKKFNCHEANFSNGCVDSKNVCEKNGKIKNFEESENGKLNGSEL
jgi:Na+/H+-dicarboxylate symporter